ncbi:MAG: hypothetical protein IPK26_24970 [Planctomycetes bacterium]|nr:hypothetical protein [Planctomycetota bacterium]
MRRRRSSRGSWPIAILLTLAAQPIAAQNGANEPVDPARAAASYRLLAQSHAVRERNPGLALLLGIEGYRQAATRLAREAVSRALMATREQRTVLVSPSGVTSVRFSPDGGRIVTTSNEGWTAIWDARTGQFLAELVGARSADERVPSAATAAFAPDGSLVLLTRHTGPALLWDPASGATTPLEHQRGEHPIRDQVAHFAAGGTRLVVGVSRNNGGSRVDPVGHVFDAQTRQQLARFDGIEPVVCGAGTHFATYDYAGKRVRVFALAAPDRPLEIVVDEGPLGVQLGASGGVAVVPTRSGLMVYDATNGRPLRRIETSTFASLVAIGEADGKRRIAVARAPSRLELYDLDSGERTSALPLDGSTATCLAFGPTGDVVACGLADGRIELVAAVDARRIASLAGHDLAVTGLCFDAAGRRLLSASADGTVRIWRVGGPDSVTELEDFQRQNSGHTAIAPDSGLLAYGASYLSPMPIWDLATGRKLADVPSNHPEDPIFLPGGERLLHRDSKATRVWSRSEPNTTVDLGVVAKNKVFALHPDGGSFVLVDGGKLRRQDLGGAVIWEVAVEQDPTAVAFSANGEHLFVARWQPRALTCLATANAKQVWRSELPDTATQGGMISTAIAASHRHVAVSIGPDAAIHILDRASGEMVTTLTGHDGTNVSVLRFSPDDSRLVTAAGDWTVRLWDTRSWQNLATVERARSWSYESWWPHALVTFSPDALYYAFCFQQEPFAQVRSCLDGALAWECRDPRDGVQALQFDQASQFLLVATRSGLVYRYPAIPILHGERARPRELLPDEYATYVLDDGDPERTTKARSYRLRFVARHRLPAPHELELVWPALVEGRLAAADLDAAASIAVRQRLRLPDCRRSRIALALAHLRQGEPAEAVAQLEDATLTLRAAAPEFGRRDREATDALLASAVRALARVALGEPEKAAAEFDDLHTAAHDPQQLDAASLGALVDELRAALDRK